MLINDKSTVVLINNVDFDVVRISRIKLENMFGKEELKGKYITIGTITAILELIRPCIMLRKDSVLISFLPMYL